MTDTDERLRETHKAALASIVEMVAALNDEDGDEDEAREAILDDALSCEVRSSWEAIGSNLTPSEYRILLTTGGPAVQIIGDLDQWGEVASASLQVQDWFKPWTEFFTTEEEDEAILAYARQFYFGA